jgi:hypothetical protein
MNTPPNMLEEISETAARGRTAEIYAEIRSSCAVAYVSSLQRFLATQPAWLAWCWDALGPGFRGGWLPAAGWRAADKLSVPQLPVITDAALRVWNVDIQAVAAIRNICDNFIRVSPTNPMFSGIARRLMLGKHPPPGGTAPQPGSAPAALPAMPELAAFDTLSADVRALLGYLGTEVNGKPFVPALYRLFAPWPPLLAHVAVMLRPQFDDPAASTACRQLFAAIEREIDQLWPAITDPGPAPQLPEHPQTRILIAAIDRYRQTSPQMVVFASMIRNALPPGHHGL